MAEKKKMRKVIIRTYAGILDAGYVKEGEEFAKDGWVNYFKDASGKFPISWHMGNTLVGIQYATEHEFKVYSNHEKMNFKGVEYSVKTATEYMEKAKEMEKANPNQSILDTLNNVQK